MIKNVLIYGLGKSGVAVKDYYLKRGINPFLFDDKIETEKKFDIEKIDLVVVSPGVDENNEMYRELEKRNIRIISELELGYQNVKGEIIAVTGTNGKTTTVSLISHILKQAYKKTYLAGNIGIPLISLYKKTKRKSKIVCEVSSFQLMKIEKFKPKISAILNLAPDHLIRHKTFENYVEAKCNIFKNQTTKDICILNYDDKLVKDLNKEIKANIFYFSHKNQIKNNNFNGTYYFNKKIFYKINNKIYFIMGTDKIKLLGEKNLENILCAVLIGILNKIKFKLISDAVNSFYPLPNRLETVLTEGNITYINDSKATNIASTLADIKAVKGYIVLLLGGSDKGEDFRDLFKSLNASNIKTVIYGATKENMQECADEVGYQNYKISDGFEDAVEMGYEIVSSLNKKAYLLLAPACASFDEFKNYEQRGEKFKELINKLNKNNY